VAASVILTTYCLWMVSNHISQVLVVNLSVTRVYYTKTVEVRIMKFSPYGSPISLVIAG